jgi:hypothetical protein
MEKITVLNKIRVKVKGNVSFYFKQIENLRIFFKSTLSVSLTGKEWELI